MTWWRVVGLLLWTALYVLFGLVVLSLGMMGDCADGPRGAACLAAKEHWPLRAISVELAIYVVATWLLFRSPKRR